MTTVSRDADQEPARYAHDVSVITFRREQELIWKWKGFAWGKVLYLIVSPGAFDIQARLF